MNINPEDIKAAYTERWSKDKVFCITVKAIEDCSDELIQAVFKPDATFVPAAAKLEVLSVSLRDQRRRDQILNIELPELVDYVIGASGVISKFQFESILKTVSDTLKESDFEVMERNMSEIKSQIPNQ